MSTPTAGQADDLPVIAACAVFYAADADLAADEWAQHTEEFRNRWRRTIAAAQGAQPAAAARMTPEQQTREGVGTITHTPTGATWITWPQGKRPPWGLIAETATRLTGITVHMRDAGSPDEPDRRAVAVYRTLPENEDE